MEGLFNPISILLHVLNAVILFVALYFLLYKPVRKFMRARQQRIQDSLKKADEAEQSAKLISARGETELDEAKAQAAKTIAQSTDAANERAVAIIAAAQSQADEIVSKAKAQADTIMHTTREAMADEAAALAVEIAKKLLSREVTCDDHQKLVSEFLNKL